MENCSICKKELERGITKDIYGKIYLWAGCESCGLYASAYNEGHLNERLLRESKKIKDE